MSILTVSQEPTSFCAVQINDAPTSTTNQAVLGTDTVDALCIDWLDRGVQETPWGPKHQCTAVFETTLKKENGYPVTISRTFNKSFHELSALRSFLKNWRGEDLTDDEIQSGFKLETTVGKSALIKYQDTVSQNGRAYLKLVDIAPAVGKLKPSGTYKRFETKNK